MMEIGGYIGFGIDQMTRQTIDACVGSKIVMII